MQVQQRVKLCVKRDLTEHDVVSRIMRKENYLIGVQQRCRPSFRRDRSRDRQPARMHAMLSHVCQHMSMLMDSLALRSAVVANP